MTFGAATETNEILAGSDLSGQTHVVTGASGGLGLETSRALAAHGATVVMVARNVEKNEAAMASIRDAHLDADLHAATLDLGNLESVRAGARQIAEAHGSITTFVGNAGVMATPFGHTDDGFETQFGTNHLGHFVLANLLVPALQAGAPSRIVLLSSGGHTMGQVNFDDPNYEHREYDEFDSYGQSKTANILCAVELDRRLKDTGVRAYAVHPGAIITELGRYFTEEVMARLTKRMSGDSDDESGGKKGGGGVEWKSVPAGAATSVWAATHPDLEGHGGIYLEDCGFSQPREEAGGSGGYADYAVDAENAKRLWALSEQLVGQEFSYQ